MKWHGSFLRSFVVKSGIRQLSPYLFNIYIDGLLLSLQSSDRGFHIGCKYTGCIAYADDVIIILASIMHLAYKLCSICVYVLVMKWILNLMLKVMLI